MLQLITLIRNAIFFSGVSHVSGTAGLYTAGGSREGGSESYCERAAFESKWSKEPVVEKKKRKVGGFSEILRPAGVSIQQR